MTETTVEYRDIPGFPGYRIGSDGSVWSDKVMNKNRVDKEKWYRLKVFVDREGYGRIKLFRNGPVRKCRRFVHVLVLEAFVGPRPDGMEACHNDGVPLNCHISNLRWDTRLGNEADKTKHGRRHIGSMVRVSKLKEGDIPGIRAAVRSGRSCASVAADHGVSDVAINKIIRGKTWRHIPDQLFAVEGSDEAR